MFLGCPGILHTLTVGGGGSTEVPRAPSVQEGACRVEWGHLCRPSKA